MWEVASGVYENHPVGRIKLLGLVLDTLQLSDCGRFAFLTVTQAMYKRTKTGPEMIDGFINYARGVRGVEVAAQLREIGRGNYRVSLRSRGKVNVAALAARFGGGGHHNAAGCGLKGTADEVVGVLTKEFQAALADI